MGAKAIPAADAAKLFAKQKIQVQVAAPAKVRNKETGVERQTMKVTAADLTADHILSAAQLDDGSVTIVTINGSRYNSKGTAQAEA